MPADSLTCPNCKADVVKYRNPFPTVDIIIRQGDSVVLIERKNEPKGWALPGGFVDYGESLESSAIREAKEETALELYNLRQFRAYSAPDRDPRQHNLSFVFTAEGKGELCGGDDAAQARLFPLDALPSPLCFDHARILADYKAAFPTKKSMRPKALSFVAKSGTGKTTLLEQVLPILEGRGYRIGMVKHDAHSFDIDHPGKDSYRLSAAGAATMLILSPAKLAMVKKHDEQPPIEAVFAEYFRDTDLVLTEGFKRGPFPKIEVNRLERSPTLMCRGEERDETLVAVVSDQQLTLDVPLLDLNNPLQVADFVEEHFIKGKD